MAAAAPPRHLIASAPRQGSVRANLLAVAAITLVFGSVLFSVNNVLLNMARSGWNRILLIQGSFAPTLDARQLYNSAAQTRALDNNGVGLPDIVAQSKIKQYDGRIIQQAAQEHRLPLPDSFFRGLP